MKYKIDIYTVCWNEMTILPFVVDYWKLYARHVYVYDNGSTDGSIDFLKQYDWISVRSFGESAFNDAENIAIKNNSWKGTDADWIVCCDIDEVLYVKSLESKLDEIEARGTTIIQPNWLECFGDTIPKYDGELLHTKMKGCVVGNLDNGIKSKCILFNPRKIKDIRYSVGAHSCNPIGEVRFEHNLSLFHFKNLSIDYLIKRYEQLNNRLSLTNKTYRLGYHYSFPKDKIIYNFNEGYKKAKPIDEFLN